MVSLEAILNWFILTYLDFLTFPIRCNERSSPFQIARISQTKNAIDITEVLARRHATSTNTRSTAGTGASAAAAGRRASARRWVASASQSITSAPGEHLSRPGAGAASARVAFPVCILDVAMPSSFSFSFTIPFSAGFVEGY